MMITEALAMSPVGVAYRHDEYGHVWLYKKNKAYIMVESEVRDNNGDKMFAEYECRLVEDFDNWEPYEHEQ